MMRRALRRILAALAVLACAGTLTACAEPGPSGASGSASGSASSGPVLRVAYLDTANYLTTVRDTRSMQRQLAKVGATVKFTGPFSPPDAYSAVSAGHADATSNGTGYFIDQVGEGQPWVAFALEKYSGDSQGIVAAPGSGVTSLRDLYGKKLAVGAPGGTGDYIAHQAFAHAGLDISQVDLVNITDKQLSSAFRGRKVDALASFDQNLAMALSTPGAREIVNGSEIGSLNWSIHVASRSFAEAHPAALKAAYRALRQEAARAKKNPRIITAAYRQFGAPDDLIDQVAKFDVPTIEPLDAKAVADLNQQAQQYVDFGFISKAPDLSGAVLDGSK